jgi:hypothetical protein
MFYYGNGTLMESNVCYNTTKEEACAVILLLETMKFVSAHENFKQALLAATPDATALVTSYIFGGM